MLSFPRVENKFFENLRKAMANEPPAGEERDPFRPDELIDSQDEGDLHIEAVARSPK
jgi:hypothetical protein